MTAITDVDLSGDIESGAFDRRLRRRRRSAGLFRSAGLGAIGIAGGMLLFLLGSVITQAIPGFMQTELRLPVAFDPALIVPDGDRSAEALESVWYGPLVTRALATATGADPDDRALSALASDSATFRVRSRVLADPGLIGTTEEIWLPAGDAVDQLWKGVTDRSLVEDRRTVTDAQLVWLDRLAEQDRIRIGFASTLFTRADSRQPADAGLLGAITGSVLTLAITLILSFPIAVAAAVYLEEFAPKNRWADLIEVNINNLAAVPSIVFGLLGLAVILNVFGVPRSTPLAGGIVLALMTLPTIIIAARAALKSVPPSIRDGALAIGASPQQLVWHQVLPLAMPGILTGTIIGMAQALGETAPLLLIGMVAFIVDVPSGLTDAATVLPVQIYIWASSPERGFVAKTSAAIIVLLLFLMVMNAAAIILRRRFERRW